MTKVFKTFVIYLSAVNLVMMVEQTILDNKEMQFVLLEYHGLCVLSATILHSQIVYCGWMLLCVSVERLITTYSPLHYQNYVYIRKFGWPLVITDIAVTGLYIAIAVLCYDRAFSVKGSGCCQLGSQETPLLGFVTLGQGFLILLTISILYTILLCKWSRVMRATPNISSMKRQKKSQTQLRKLNMTIGAILASKFIGWLPLLIMVIFRTTPYAVPMLDYVGRISCHLFSVMCPIAYGFTSLRYRRFLVTKIAEHPLRRLRRSSISSSKHAQSLGDVNANKPYSLRYGVATVLGSNSAGNAVNNTVDSLDEEGCYGNPVQAKETAISESQFSTHGDEDSLENNRSPSPLPIDTTQIYK